MAAAVADAMQHPLAVATLLQNAVAITIAVAAALVAISAAVRNDAVRNDAIAHVAAPTPVAATTTAVASRSAVQLQFAVATLLPNAVATMIAAEAVAVRNDAIALVAAAPTPAVARRAAVAEHQPQLVAAVVN